MPPPQRQGPEDPALDVGRAAAASRDASGAGRQAKRPADQPPPQGPPREGVLCQVGGPLLLALLLGQRAAGEAAENWVLSQDEGRFWFALATGTCVVFERGKEKKKKWNERLLASGVSAGLVCHPLFMVPLLAVSAVGQETCGSNEGACFIALKLIGEQGRALQSK